MMSANVQFRVSDGAKPDILFELFVAGDNPYSTRARTNLDKLIEGFSEPFAVRIIDVQDHPSEALTRRIFATPALVITAGKRTQIVVGDLSNPPLGLREFALRSVQDMSR